MALIDNYVARIEVTHQRYGAGDVIHFKQKEWDAYQRDAPGNPDAFRKLVRLLYVEKPDGSRVMADEKGKITDKSKVVPPAQVAHEKEVRSTVSRLCFTEKLDRDAEGELTERALVEVKPEGLEKFKADPAGFFQGKNRMGAGPAQQRA